MLTFLAGFLLQIFQRTRCAPPGSDSRFKEIFLDLRLQGLTALVTGGTAGIGLAIAKQFAAEGCNIITFSRSKARTARARSELESFGVNVIAEEHDVRSAEMLGWAKSLQGIDIFIPNVSATSSDWNDSIETDLKATVNLTEAILPVLRNSRKAAITYVGSKASSYATPGFESYGAVKAAISHYMKSLSQKLGGSIRVNTVSPGDTFVEDGLWDNIKKNAPDVYAAAEKSNPMRRFCTPGEIASAVVFVSSPVASFINGSNLFVDGGATVHVHG
jgi:NAD(P)-dependent dehydrogenase (short-subunit alcohol dehydrogenase family)